jgi:hypothetical protein
MLKITITMLILMNTFVQAKAEIHLPQTVIGTLTIDNMTEGQLLWMKGKVGQGKYSGIDEQGRHCSIDVPVVIGSFSETSIGIQSSKGVEIAVTSSELNEALLSGRPINNSDWVFRANPPSDGYIISGIEPSEQFILNSRKRWASWFLDEKVTPSCL